MNQMFHNCISLLSLKIDNFDTSKVTDMFSMFGNCGSLISLNLTNFRIIEVQNCTNILIDCDNDLIFCFNETELSKIVSQIILTNPNYINDCSNIIFKNIKNINDSSIENDINCNLIDFFNNNCKIINQPEFVNKMINYIRNEILKDSSYSLVSNIFNEKKIF